jgi:hypothetical protein
MKGSEAKASRNPTLRRRCRRAGRASRAELERQIGLQTAGRREGSAASAIGIGAFEHQHAQALMAPVEDNAD